MGIRGRACECIGMQSMYVLCFMSDREPSTYDVRTTWVTAIAYVVLCVIVQAGEDLLAYYAPVEVIE